MASKAKKIVYLLQLNTGRIIYISPNVEGLLGLPPAKFYMDGFGVFNTVAHDDEDFVLYPEPTYFSEDIARLYTSEVVLRCRSGGFRPFEHNAVVLEKDEADNPHILVGSFTLVPDAKAINGCSGFIKARDHWRKGPPFGIAALTRSKRIVSHMDLEGAGPDRRLEILMNERLHTSLSLRQKQVVKYLAKGYSAKRIADKMSISESTVIDHKKKLLALFDAKNTVEMIAKASKLFWI